MAKTLLVLCSGVLLGGCSSVPVKTVDYRGWEAVQLDNGVARAVIVPGVARVMVFERAGGANLIWQDKALWGIPANLATGDWQNFGGSKLWAAPQAAWGWPPDPAMDRGPCGYAIGQDGSIHLRGMPSQTVGVRLDREISLADGRAALDLEYTMQNTTSSNVTWGIWNIIQMQGGGRVLLPTPKGVSVREDKRWHIWEHWQRIDDIFVLHHTGQEGKVMSIGPEGWIAYEKAGEVFVLSFRADPDAVYPEGHGCGEVYAGGSYIELEHVAPLTQLAPGETTQTTERWILFSLDGAQIDDRELAARVRGLLAN